MKILFLTEINGEAHEPPPEAIGSCGPAAGPPERVGDRSSFPPTGPPEKDGRRQEDPDAIL